ncbi:unnamed protein product [Oppiella nova]|uniref:Uncharacterized protein n=1 Tax=Oppiella nova TaxID=334625 RepID=A0A7R9QIL6_9ACAR|nr:unnamed protein product [Oppiella nova]CAG2166093.1 unnamed protein product [Oppiella nova]
MSVDSSLFVFALFDTSALLFLTVYIVITLSDLECDYLNAQQCCNKLNKWVIPELISYAILVILLLFTNHWFIFLLNGPMLAWIGHKYYSIPKGNIGFYDATEVHNRGNLKHLMKFSMIRLAFHLIHFFIYLYCMIIALLTNQ